jgi:DNA-binding response OmpR family regulator
MNPYLCDVLLVVEDPDLIEELADQLRRAGYVVRCAPTLDEAASLLRSGHAPAFLILRLKGRRRSVGDLTRELRSRLPGWDIDVQTARADDRAEPGPALLN